ncbi:MAG: BTAD domain-containing putative transcriptional regulator [Egibacteraceae bacterium]
MEVRILGPLEVEVNGQQVRFGPQQCVLLAILLLEEGRVVPTSRLVELLWGQAAPERATATLRSHVLRLRRALEPDRPAGAKPTMLVTEGAGEGAGYALRIRPEQLDAVRFEQLVDEGRAALAAGDPRTTVERLRAGLALWRGSALADVADRPFALREVARLEGVRRAARQVRIEADLMLGRHAEVLGELAGLVADQPGDEQVRRVFALALYRSHRIEDAARVCQEGLELLSDRGLDSPVLQELQRDLLRGAPALDWVPPQAARPFQIPPDISDFIGRQAELAALRARLLAVVPEPGPAVAISAIDGKPGIGKSALAIHLAHAVAAQFADGVLWVNLRGAESEPLTPAQVLGQFLRALGVPDQQIPGDLDAAVASYRSALAAKQVLVVLDNAASAAQVRPLLPSNPSCAVLITSRAPLADLEEAAPLTLDLLTETDAVALLARLAGQERVDTDSASAAQVVRQCGLLPLAVRIAGARLRTRPHWPLATFVFRLADERHRLSELAVGELAVRSSFLLSYRGLKTAEARMFRLLGLLHGPGRHPGRGRGDHPVHPGRGGAHPRAARRCPAGRDADPWPLPLP